MRESTSSLFTAKRDNSADDGAPVSKRDTECSHGNRCRGHIGPRPAIDNRKDKRQPPGIRDIFYCQQNGVPESPAFRELSRTRRVRRGIIFRKLSGDVILTEGIRRI